MCHFDYMIWAAGSMYWEKNPKKILTEKVFVAPKSKNCSIKQKNGLSGVKRGGYTFALKSMWIFGPKLVSPDVPKLWEFHDIYYVKVVCKNYEVLRIALYFLLNLSKISRSSPVRFSTETKSSRSRPRQHQGRRALWTAREPDPQNGVPCWRCSRSHG